eukprot:scaffold111475_cov63-Phaeocystis_antarctica.AAC.2
MAAHDGLARLRAREVTVDELAALGVAGDLVARGAGRDLVAMRLECVAREEQQRARLQHEALLRLAVGRVCGGVGRVVPLELPP